MLELPNFLSQASSKREQTWEWQVLTKGYEMHLVIAGGQFTFGIDHSSRVENRPFCIWSCAVTADRTGDDPGIRLLCQLTEPVAEASVVREEGRRRLGPYD